VQIEFENGDRLLPKVFIKDDIFNDLYLSWKDLLVIKLLGKIKDWILSVEHEIKKFMEVDGRF